MTIMPISQFREKLSDLADCVAHWGERITISRNGKNQFALISMEDLETLQMLEDKLDLDSIRAASDQKTVPWEQVKAELGRSK